MRLLVVIPARSGSKGLRHKNLKRVGPDPLMIRAIKLAQSCQRRGERWEIAVSSDSAHYLRLAKKAGARAITRPKKLASDKARLVDVVDHAITMSSPCDAVMMLSCTTPFTTPVDLRKAINLFKRAKTAVVPVTQDDTPDSWRLTLNKGRTYRHLGDDSIRPRQQSVLLYKLSGAFYLASPLWLRKHRQFYVSGKSLAVVLPKARALDIEDAHDLMIARFLEQNRRPHAQR